MAAQTGLDFEGAFNNATTGLYKNNTTRDISPEDLRALPTAIKESYLNRIDDAYTAMFPQVTASETNTYAATLSPAITAYATGQKFQIKFTNASSGVSTLNLNAVGAKKIFINPTTQATTGHIVAGQISLFAYDAALDSAAGGFLMLGSATDTSGFVTSVNGTANRITSTGGATPTIDIDPAYDAAITAQIAAAQVGLWDDRGSFSAAGGAYPSSGGSGSAGEILKGDIWTISVAGTLPTGQVVEVGDTVRALIDTPGNTQANWAILQNNIGFTPENAANKATNLTSPDNTKYPTTLAVSTESALKQALVNTAVALTDASSMDLTAIKHTLTTSSATRTFTISYTGDDITLEVTLNATASTFTFPATALCVSDGLASGDNTCALAGISGDKYIIAIKKIGSAYYVVCKNFGQ